jgi:TetR/AcrR family transcriptional regulator, regulator of cefoperazone and chloramphenicol sensitivity
MKHTTRDGSRRVRRNDAAPRRHPPSGGYARGEETRTRIIAAALKVFGDQGYDQASTRHIAANAGVNPPALQYYFGGKEGLHRACGQHIVDRILMILSPALTQAATVRSGDRTRAVAALCTLLDALAEGLAAAGSETWRRFIDRSKADDAGPAMAMMHESIGRPLLETAMRLIGIATARSRRDAATRLRAYAILGQVTSIYAHREKALTDMNWREFDGRALALIKSVVREHTCAALAAAGGPPGNR